MSIKDRNLRRARRSVLALERFENRVLMATGPPLGAAASFAILGGAMVTSTGASQIVGDVGVSPGTSITGFPPAVITGGSLHAGDATASQAELDLGTAYNDLAGDAYLPANDLSGQDLGGLTLTPGVYHFAAAAQLGSTLTLDAQGDPNAVFVIQVGTSLTTSSHSSVVLTNNAHAANVYWQVGSSATLGSDTAFQGSILAYTSITMDTGASMGPGRALALNGAVTLDTNSVSASFTSPLTVTASNQVDVYGSPLPPLTASYTGFVNGDTSASLTTLPTLSTTATASSPVGTYPITASGAVDANYTISYVVGTLTITPAPLTITADGQAKGYGAALPPLTASYTGFVNGDTSASLTTLPTLSTTATSASTVSGSPYLITASGAVDANYAISYVAGSLDLTPVALTITADDQSRTAGTALPPLTASYTGFVNGDTSASLTTLPTLSTTATSSDNLAGSTFPIVAAGADDPNYTISYVAGTLSVTPASATHYVITGAIGGPAGVPELLTVTAEDQFGNVDTGYIGTVHFTSNDPLATLPADATLSEGVGTFAVTFATAGSGSITATDVMSPGITATVTVMTTTTVSGKVYLDLNAGGTPDPGERGLVARVVFLDLNHDGTFTLGEPTATTDANGHYAFIGVTTPDVAVLEDTGQDPLGRYVVDQSRTNPDGTIDIGVVPFSPADPVKVVPNPFSLEPDADANTAYVQSLYKAVLGRVGGNNEVATWLVKMTSGMNRSEVALGFVNSLEHRQDQVQGFYEAFLHRAPEPTSVVWVDDLRAGATEESVVEGILDSDEYQSAHQDQALFVQDLYLDVLGRQGEAGGVAGWESALSSGTSRQAVVAAFVQSNEAIDQVVDSFYTAFLHRSPEPVSSDLWAMSLESPGGSATNVAVGILSSTEFDQDATTPTI